MVSFSFFLYNEHTLTVCNFNFARQIYMKFVSWLKSKSEIKFNLYVNSIYFIEKELGWREKIIGIYILNIYIYNIIKIKL